MFSSARALAAGGAAALALALAAAPAPAQSSDEFRQVYRGFLVAEITTAARESNDAGTVTRETHVRFLLDAWVPELEFVDGRLLPQRVFDSIAVTRAEARSRYVNSEAEPVEVIDCAASEGRALVPGVANPLREFDDGQPPTAVGLALSPMTAFELPCSEGPPLRLGLGGRAHGPADFGPSHLRVALLLPPSKIGEEEFRVDFRQRYSELSNCPGHTSEELRSCVTTLDGYLSLTRTFPEFTRRSSDDDLLAPPSPPKLDRGARRATTRARCRRGCRYEIKVFLTPRNGRGRLGKSAAAGVRTIARAAGRLPASGAARTLSVTIPPRWRAAVRADGGALVRATLTPPRGRATAKTGFARLPR